MATGGGRLVGHPPVFTLDGKRALVCSGNNIHVYSVSTCEQLLVLRGHLATVTAVVVESLRLGVNLLESGQGTGELSQAWSASLDKTIKQWDYLRGTLLRSVAVGYPIKSMVVPGLQARGGLAAFGRDAFLSVWWKHGQEPSQGKGPAVKLQKKVKSKKKGGRKSGAEGEGEGSGELAGNGADSMVAEQGGDEHRGEGSAPERPDEGEGARPLPASSSGRRSGRVLQFDLVKGEVLLPFLARTNEPHQLFSSLRGGLVGTYDQHTVLVWRTSDNKQIRLHHTKVGNSTVLFQAYV
jgi:hypothetical protein